MDIKFSELALAGAQRLFADPERRQSVLQAIALALRFDPTRNATRLGQLTKSNFWIRGFFASADVRVLFELDRDITVWSLSISNAASGVTE